MSTTFIWRHRVFATPRVDRDPLAGAVGEPRRGAAERTGPPGWRRQALEILALIAVLALGQRHLSGGADLQGLPHLYWLPVLLAACQYGVPGGMIAAVAASAAFFLELSPQSAAEDFYSYARMAALQPAMWLATALVVGGLRSLHIHQQAEVAEQLAASRRRAADLGEGLELATSEIHALERRIAEDSSSVAAVTRALAQIDMRDRRSAAASLGELFRVGAGVGTFVVYLPGADGYAPVFAVEKDAPRPAAALRALPGPAMDAMIADAARLSPEDWGIGASGPRRQVVLAPQSGAERLAAVVCDLEPSQDLRTFRRRAEDLARLFATVLAAFPDAPPGGAA